MARRATSVLSTVISAIVITDLKTFTGSGREIQANHTVGYFARF